MYKMSSLAPWMVGITENTSWMVGIRDIPITFRKWTSPPPSAAQKMCRKCSEHVELQLKASIEG